MTRPGAPARGSGDGAAPWLIPAAALVVLTASAALWAGGDLAAGLSGHGWHPGARFSPLLLITVVRDRGTAAVWPGVPAALVLTLAGVLAAVVLLPAAFLVLRRVLRAGSPDPSRSLASAVEVRPMTPGPAAETARRLRPSLAGARARDLSPGDVGLLIGELRPRGPRLFASWEDVVLAIMAPRSGKTTALAIPAVLSAPGAVIGTANKSDLWAATAELRAEDTGERVWTFDPQRIARAPRTWFWDPVADLVDVEDAERLASHFVLTVDDDRARDIWGPAAQELLAALLLAAKLGGEDLHTVYRWLSAEDSPQPVKLLSAAFPALGAALRGTMSAPVETRGSVYFTARTAAKCLRSPAITEWVTPPAAGESLDRFDPAGFVRSRQSLYLLSKDGGGSAAPLVAALTDRVLRAAVVEAEAQGGRLDPPLVAVLDEAANICRIGDLPALYSHLGSRGIVPVTILQSYAQAVGVWGESGTKTLYGAATVKLIGSGMDDASFAEDLSRLVGEHDVTADSWSSGNGRSSRTRATRTERILTAADVRALPKGTALLLATGVRPAMVRTLPWHEGTRAGSITGARDRAAARLAGTTAGSVR